MSPDTCVHYTGCLGRGPECAAGVNYRELAGAKAAPVGWIKRLPCIPRISEGVTPAACDKFRVSTTEEIVADKAEWDAIWQRHLIVTPVVSEWRRKPPTGKQEVIECPACKGRLHLSQSAYNGHVHGHCETQGCVSWME